MRYASVVGISNGSRVLFRMVYLGRGHSTYLAILESYILAILFSALRLRGIAGLPS
jgi:hypothetical protein